MNAVLNPAPQNEAHRLLGASWQQHARRTVGVLGVALLLLTLGQPFKLSAAAEQAQFLTERCFAVANEPGPTDIFFEIDLNTGISTKIGPLKSTSEVEAIAFIPAPTDPQLYAANAGQFGLVRLNTGASGNSVVFDPIGNGFGNGHGTDGNHLFDDVDGLAYDVAKAQMYGVHRRTGGDTDLLFIIDVTTGKLVRDAFFIDGELRDYAEIESVGGLHDVDDIAIDPHSGRMFGVINSDGRSGILVEIDPATGAVLQSYPAADATGQIVDDIEGLAFAGDGTLYGSTGENGPDNGDANRLFQLTVDQVNAVALAAEVSEFPDELEDVEALACLTSVLLPASIDLEKATNGVDADLPTGPVLPVGNTVTWSYVVVNTGEAALENVSVSDDQLPPGSIACPQSTLAPGESMTCTATGSAMEGQYANVGTVTANPVGGTDTVSDSDPSHYLGIAPAIDIEKATNGVDADTPAEAPAILTGEVVAWTYVVQNTGSVALADVTIDDDILGPIDCAEGPIPTLAPGDAFTCTATGTATAGDYANVGTTTGTPVDSSGTPFVDDSGTPIAKPVDSDPSHYVGIQPGIELEKRTNGADADEPPGVEIPVGEPVTWTYVVTNTGDVALDEVTVTDDQIDQIDCPGSTLAPGESMTCTATGIAEEGPYVNMGTAQGKVPFNSVHVKDEDPSHYIGLLPNIEITKTVKVAWSYVISNTGEAAFDRLSVDGGPDVTVTCPQTTLAPGERITCPATGPQARYENSAVVTAYRAGSNTPTRIEVAAVPVRTLSLDLRASGQRPKLVDPPHLPADEPLAWTLHITNSGTTEIADIAGMIFTLPGGDGIPATCPQSTLGAGQSTVCTASDSARNGVTWVVGSVTGRAADTGGAVAQTVPGRYHGIAPASVGGNLFVDRVESNGRPNGMQDPGEEPFTHPNMIVQLHGVDGTLLDSTGVAEDGGYQFDGLPPGDYYLTFVRPVVPDVVGGFPWTAADAHPESVDSDGRPEWHPDPDTARTHFFRLKSGQRDLRWDLGIAQVAVSGTIWFDDNVNGERERDEAGVNGVTVQLIDSDGNVIETTTSDATGRYSFGAVPPGEYELKFTLPPGYASTPSGTQQTVNLGIYPFSDTIFMPLISR